MATGWAGLSMVCYADALQAVQASCAGTPACQGVSGDGSPGVGGSQVFPVTMAGGQAYSLAVQPCERIDASFFGGLLPVFIPAVIAVLCAKKIWRMFDTHA